MEITTCSHLKASLLRRLNDHIEIGMVADQCVLTLPIKSIDDRPTEVFIEQGLGGFFRVHDAGIATSHLFAQGIHVTEAKASLFGEVARRLGVEYMRGTFEKACTEDEIENAILSVGQCAAMATVEVAAHKPSIEEEPVKTRVDRSLAQWKPEFVKQINKNVRVKGQKKTHQYDFVSFPHEPKFNTVAVKILAPSYSPQAQADRYGFLVLDSEKIAPYDHWNRLAIVTKVEQWGDDALRLVNTLSSQTVTLKSGEEEHIEKIVPQVMQDLSKKAA
jgi:hypothetical protein